MKSTNYIIGLLLILFVSCDQPKQINDDSIHQESKKIIPQADELIEQLFDLPDTILKSPKADENKFHLKLSPTEIKKEYSKFDGEWITIVGGLNFHRTKMDPGNRVVFVNKETSQNTGWGDIKYNRMVRFYLLEDVSYNYDYFIDDDRFLNIIEYDIRNDDLSFKEKPEPIVEKLGIIWRNDNEFEFVLNGIKFKMKRKTNANKL